DTREPLFRGVGRTVAIRLFSHAGLSRFPERFRARCIGARDGEEEEFTHETSTAWRHRARRAVRTGAGANRRDRARTAPGDQGIRPEGEGAPASAAIAGDGRRDA